MYSSASITNIRDILHKKNVCGKKMKRKKEKREKEEEDRGEKAGKYIFNF